MEAALRKCISLSEELSSYGGLRLACETLYAFYLY